ncbi:patatin-like phospholipase family protein [Burkholderia ambifaria]|uniref:patatin-like phospholipase family protein n=1 Tax=Burkholderia ambifaria TaxID=152480 RepID=UPI0015892910|nr:patatin-like phospholipase family protein [Burkholderia ambifaria]
MAEDEQNVAQAARSGTTWPSRPTLSPEVYFATPPAQDGVFEVGLVMGGTVSAGTFSGGVLDFLFEALDAWDDARRLHASGKMDNVPQHHVRIRIITGTSGGGISAVLAARALHYRFPPAAKDSPVASEPSPNPFYEVWVNDIDIEKLLDTSDLTGDANPPLLSILNGQPLTAIAENNLGEKTDNPPAGYPSAEQLVAAQKAGHPIDEVTARSWVYNPLMVVVTHSNLCGVPYSQMFTFDGMATAAEYFTNHADYVRLYFGYSPHSNSKSPGGRLIPDAKFVSVPAGFHLPAPPRPAEFPTATAWRLLAQNVLGTSAFPVGFPARVVNRDGANYAYRFAWNTQAGSYDWITPVWPKVAPVGLDLNNYAFLSLDGGCTNNEPIIHASQALEGLERSPRHLNLPKADEANRAIVLVDPLCDPLPGALEAEVTPLLSLLWPTLQMFIRSNRFATADMAGFLNSDIYNRYLVAPKRPKNSSTGLPVVGGDAICGEGMGAFMGFLCRDFREHDFMLGRRNCQAFLTGTFTLSTSNPVFMGSTYPVVPANLKAANCPTPPSGQCPIVPLFGSAAAEQPLPGWPTGKFDPTDAKFAKQVNDRVVESLKHLGKYLRFSRVEQAAEWVFVHTVLAPKICDKVVAYIKSELGRKGL